MADAASAAGGEDAADGAQALAAAPAGAMRSVAWRTRRKGSWTLRLGDAQLVAGVATEWVGREPLPRGGIARMVRRIHHGTGTPFVWRVFIFLGELLPAVLAVTGITMWSRSRRQRLGRRLWVTLA